jgi:DNA-binding MarR family transcriptional regulator
VPNLRETLEGLFVEAATIEHLVRTRIETKYVEELGVGHFGILVYFTRSQQFPDSVAGIAWSFQEDEDRVATQVRELAEKGYVELTPGIKPSDTMVAITESGRAARAAMLDRMGPDFMSLVSEIPEEELEIAHRVLRDIRLVLDNLPDR